MRLVQHGKKIGMDGERLEGFFCAMILWEYDDFSVIWGHPLSNMLRKATVSLIDHYWKQWAL